MNEKRKVPNSIRQWVANQATIALPLRTTKQISQPGRVRPLEWERKCDYGRARDAILFPLREAVRCPGAARCLRPLCPRGRAVAVRQRPRTRLRSEPRSDPA